MHHKKIGILGGGQLGKMLCQDASKLGLSLHILEKDNTFPAYSICSHYTYGDFKNYEDVYNFGKDKDIITVEIEAVNTKALHDLQAAGKEVYPQPEVLDIIKDKGLQKQFYADHGFPTSDFHLYKDADDLKSNIKSGNLKYPFVQKSRTDGYDGQGVAVIKNEADLSKLISAPCLSEDLVDIEKEISIIVARNTIGEIKAFPVVEMEFHPTANLVEYLFAPSNIPQAKQSEAIDIAISITEKLKIVGLLAVELFLTKEGNILINEVAPRPHNSGHQTIEGNITSQYEQHIRAITGMPLGDTATTGASVMVNLLGEEGSTGPTKYHNIEDCLKVSGAHLHLYGKAISKPYRKMGHATIVADKLEKAVEKAKFIKNTLSIKGDGKAS